MPELDTLDLRIIEALQIDGRASWRKIAAALGENERTVARRGADLLVSGAVTIAAIHLRPVSLIVRARCEPGISGEAIETLAKRNDTSFVYAVTGPTDVVAEVLTTPERLGQLVMSDIPTTAGVISVESYPVLKFFRTIGGWRLGVLSSSEAQAMGASSDSDYVLLEPMAQLEATDAAIVDCLRADGRIGFEELGQRTGVSESTARRRVEWLLATKQIQIRALVEPETAGLSVEGLIWFRLSPQRVERVARSLVASQKVRYAAVIAGTHQLLVDVTVRSMNELHDFVSEADWIGDVDGMEMSLIVSAKKRGGRIVHGGATR